MTNVFHELHEYLLETEVVVALAKVSIIEEYEGTELSFSIEEVLEGNDDVQGDLFFVEKSEWNEDVVVYQAELKLSWYENLSFPNIECINISPAA